MQRLLSPLVKKINSLSVHFMFTGLFLVIFAILTIYYDFFLRITVAFTALVGAWIMFYTAYKIRAFKKDIEKYFKL